MSKEDKKEGSAYDSKKKRKEFMSSDAKHALMKACPDPEVLKGNMPALNKTGMLKSLLQGDISIIANMTLMAVLIGTVNALMDEYPDWEQFISTNTENDEEPLPEPCGDPECQGCKELEKAMKHAKEHGGVVKAVRLTKKQAMEMGLIDAEGKDLQPGAAGHCKDQDLDGTEDSTDKVIH